MAKKRKSDNLLDYIPVRNVQWENSTEGCAVLNVPKFKRKWMFNLLIHLKIEPVYKLNLDEKGTAIWKYCDGSDDLYHIALKLREKYGDDIEPVFDRLNAFIRQLFHQKLIKLDPPR
jgi:hypothetical protein